MDFKSLSKLMKERRSVFPGMYTDQKIEVDTVMAILENALWAPNHKNTQPWKFIVYMDKGKDDLANFAAQKYKAAIDKEKFTEFKFNKILRKINQSKVVIAIILDRNVNVGVPEWEEVAALGCAVQNIWLSCTSLNIGCYWSSPKYLIGNDPFFNLEGHQKCLGIFYMGYIDKHNLTSQRVDVIEKVILNV